MPRFTKLFHHFDVPRSCLPQDLIFHFIAYLHELNPLTWARHSMDSTPGSVASTTKSEAVADQLIDLNCTLHLIEHTLAQDWQLWCISKGFDGRALRCWSMMNQLKVLIHEQSKTGQEAL